MTPLADAHLHLFRRGYSARYGAGWGRRNELEAYEALRDAHHIEHGIVVGYEGQPRFRGNNRDLATWATTRAWMVPLAFVAVARPPTAGRLARLVGAGFAGVAIYATDPRDAEYLSRWPSKITDGLSSQGMMVSLNAARESLHVLKPFMERLAGCDVLVSHLGLPGRFTQPPSARAAGRALAPLRSLAGLKNVAVKISGLYAISSPSHAFPHAPVGPLLHHTYDAFGPHRLLWGSDFSPALEHVSFAQTIAAIDMAGWPERDQRRILHGNLAALLARRQGRAAREPTC